MNLIDLTGQKFGRLTVKGRVDSSNKHVRWKCRCECGNEIITQGNHLRAGRTTSCRCLLRDFPTQLRHGHSPKNNPSRTYTSWQSMIQRCTNPNHPRFDDYGGRGITVCKRWMKFDNFLTDMGEKPPPPPRMTLERKKNNRGYSKSNCKWATYKEQANNQRPKRPRKR